MKKVIRILSLVFLFSIYPILAEAQWITDSEYAFKIKVPSSWSKEKKQEGSDRIHDFLDPTQNVFIEVRAFESVDGVNVDNLSKLFESSALPNAEKLAYQDYTLNGVSGKFGGYKTTIDGLSVGIGAFYAVLPNYSYIVWSLIPVDGYGQYSAASDEVLSTFTTLTPTIKNNTSQPIVAPNSSITLSAFKISDRMTKEHDITTEKTIFDPSTEFIYVVYDWKGNGNGSSFLIDWYYENKLINGSSKEFKMPNAQDGYGFASITMDGKFKVGSYYVDAKVNGKVFGTIQFKVESASVASSLEGNVSHTQWGSAHVNMSSSEQFKTNSYKTVNLDSKNNAYNFKKGSVKASESADILNEPWCTDLPALCGNWINTGQSKMEQVTSPPKSGYLSDNKSFVDCQQVPINQVLVFKLKDGSFAKVIVTKDYYSKTNSGCEHKITLVIEYPAF